RGRQRRVPGAECRLALLPLRDGAPMTAVVAQDSPAAAAPQGNALQMALATGAFAVCFAVFGSVSAMMPILRDRLELSPMQVSIALAFPVLLGSLGRIPLGMLTDRFGGRIVFLWTMALACVP